MLNTDLRARREAIVREHLASENAYEFDRTIATFEHPRYELVATGDVYDGEEAVRGYFAESRRAFPDQRNELIALHHADDAVIVEVDILGRTSDRCARFRPRAARSGAARVRTSYSRMTTWSASASTSTNSRSCASSGLHMTHGRSRDG